MENMNNMKKTLTTLLIAILTMTTVNSMTLTERQKGLAACACLMAPADREIVTVAALSALTGVETQLEAHKRGAVNMGNSQQLVDELCAWLNHEGYTLTATFPKGVANVNYAKYFTGDSFVCPIQPANLREGERAVLPTVNVTFEPRCRNNWHVHHGARQAPHHPHAHSRRAEQRVARASGRRNLQRTIVGLRSAITHASVEKRSKKGRLFL